MLDWLLSLALAVHSSKGVTLCSLDLACPSLLVFRPAGT